MTTGTQPQREKKKYNSVTFITLFSAFLCLLLHNYDVKFPNAKLNGGLN